MNILIVRKLGLCSGCGACIVICPSEAISMHKGRILNVPVVNNLDCINCEKCLEICPGYDNYCKILSGKAKCRSPIINQLPKCSICHSKDQKIRKNASSGGYITTLLATLLEKGIIDGVITLESNINDPVELFGSLITDIQSIKKSKGSKYFPVSVCEGLIKIAELKGHFAFVGKPCEVHAARLIVQSSSEFRDKLILLISLFCHHTPPRKTVLEFLKNNGIKNEAIDKLKYRGNGWPGYFQIINKEGDILLKMQYRKLWDKYLSKSTPISCKMCYDPFGDCADISVGDAWGFHDSTSQGYSAVLLRNETGIIYHNLAVKSNAICCFETTFEKITIGQKPLVTKINHEYIIYEVYRFLNKKTSIMDIIYLLFKRKLSLIDIIKILKYWIEIHKISISDYEY